MDTIRNYLDTMFKDLPNTQEVLKAKSELESMMEDKYQELMSVGSPEHEAIAQVIAEFGNIDELFPKVEKTENMMDIHRVKDYLIMKRKTALMIGIGVGLCIMSVIFPILGSLNETKISIALGASGMFICIAIAVGSFIKSHMDAKRYDDLKETVPTNEIITYLREEKEKYQPRYTMLMIIGVACCIVSVVPAIILEALYSNTVFEEVAAIGLFILVGIGVTLIVSSNIRYSGYELSEDIEEEEEEEDSVYWNIVTALYLCISFLTFRWWQTWIIWPIAALLEKPIKNLLGGFIHE